MTNVDVTGLYRVADALEDIVIELRKIEGHLRPGDSVREVRVKTDRDGDAWYETTPDHWTWGGFNGGYRSAVERADEERYEDTDSIANVPTAALGISQHRPFKDAEPHVVREVNAR